MSDNTADDDDAVASLNGQGDNVSDEDLRAMLAQERKARQQERDQRTRAERERDDARGHATTAIDQRWQAEEQSLDAGLAAVETEADGLEQRIAALNAEGSYAEAAKASRQLAKAEAQISLINQKKTWLTDAREATKQQAEAAPRQQPRQQPREGGIDMAQFSPRQREWIEEHPEYRTSPRFRDLVAGAHFEAKNAGIVVDSEEYFDAIDARLAATTAKRRKLPETEDDDGEEAPAPRRRDNGGALPVQRRAPGGGQRDGVVRLSADQREAADTTMPDIPVDDWEENGRVQPGRYRRYAQRMAQLKQQGRLN